MTYTLFDLGMPKQDREQCAGWVRDFQSRLGWDMDQLSLLLLLCGSLPSGGHLNGLINTSLNVFKRLCR